MADMCYYGNVMTTIRWRMCYYGNVILHLQQYSHRLNLLYWFFYASGQEDGQMDGQTGKTNLIFAFRSFANSPENRHDLTDVRSNAGHLTYCVSTLNSGLYPSTSFEHCECANQVSSCSRHI